MNPYSNIERRQSFRHGVANTTVFTVNDFYRKKFNIGSDDKIATAGSCFAQHIAKRLMGSGYKFLDVEPPPQLLSKIKQKEFGYNTYSARYGNIYTARQLVQLAEEVLGIIPTMPHAWIKVGRYFDPLRPAVEPAGLCSNEEYLIHRAYHLKQVKRLLKEMDVFIFTLGLTEYWHCNETGRALPIAPGVIAGEYDEAKFSFKNMNCFDVIKDIKRFMNLVAKIRGNCSCKYLFTVSPVPLAATAMRQHVLCATTYSKSVLRAAAGELEQQFDNVDYFPSYEVITAPWSRGIFYDIDQRNVLDVGVDTVMRIFFQQHPPVITNKSDQNSLIIDQDNDDVVCEEALIEVFIK